MTEKNVEKIKLKTKYYIDKIGRYIGGFDESIQEPENSINIVNPPSDARQVYNFEKKAFDPFIENYLVAREREYNKMGATVTKLAVVSFKKIIGEDVQAEIDAIQALRQQVEQSIPKN